MELRERFALAVVTTSQMIITESARREIKFLAAALRDPQGS